MDLTVFAERLYLHVTGELTGLALLVAFLSLAARGLGMRRGYTLSRPAALYGMIGTIGSLAAFYLLYAMTGQPESIAARGGVVRLLLINHSLALLHWNWDYVRLALRRGR